MSTDHYDCERSHALMKYPQKINEVAQKELKEHPEKSIDKNDRNSAKDSSIILID